MQNAVFFPGDVLSKEGFCFSKLIESAKRGFAARAGSRTFLKNEKQNSRKKITGQCFPVKKTGLKSHLRGFCRRTFTYNRTNATVYF